MHAQTGTSCAKQAYQHPTTDHADQNLHTGQWSDEWQLNLICFVNNVYKTN